MKSKIHDMILSVFTKFIMTELAKIILFLKISNPINF